MRFLNNANRVWKVWDRFGIYLQLARELRARGVSWSDIGRTQFGRYMRDAPKPPIVTIELTNHCDLRCTYCANQTGWRKRGFMADDTFSHVLQAVMGLHRVRLVGHGEPTLHPHFAEWVRDLAPVVKHLTVVTNGHWRRPDVVRAMIDAPVDLIEVSVEADNQEEFAGSRKGANLELVLENLRELRRLRDGARGRSAIQVRLMVRPSHLPRKSAMLRFWRRHADRAMCQYVLRTSEMLEPDDDLFRSPFTGGGGIPKCNYPFKCFDVLWDGRIPLCSHYTQCGRPDIMIGDIRQDSICDLWSSPTLQAHRQAHRGRNPSDGGIAHCRGCMGY